MSKIKTELKLYLSTFYQRKLKEEILNSNKRKKSSQRIARLRELAEVEKISAREFINVKF
jgi:hypothetical protein